MSMPSSRIAPCRRVVESHQQAHERRLARPGRSRDPDAIARRDLERDVVQHLRARRDRRSETSRNATAPRAPERTRVAAARRRRVSSSSEKARSALASAACRSAIFRLIARSGV